MINQNLSSNLNSAYNWIDAAGEIDTLALMMSETYADAYAEECEANALEHGDTSVTAADVLGVWRWLATRRSLDAVFLAR